MPVDTISMNGRTATDRWLKEKERIEEEMDRTGSKRLNVNLPISLHRKLKVKSAQHHETMSDVVIRLIWEYVKDEKY